MIEKEDIEDQGHTLDKKETIEEEKKALKDKEDFGDQEDTVVLDLMNCQILTIHMKEIDMQEGDRVAILEIEVLIKTFQTN